MNLQGFFAQIIYMMMSVTVNGKVHIKVNSDMSPHYTTHRGVRQGDPFSSFIFNIVIDVIDFLIHQAQNKGNIHGLATNFQASFSCCKKGRGG
jgi:hypothetical protein